MSGTTGGIRTTAALVATEIRIQFRGGLYAAYAAMTAFFFGLLLLLPAAYRPQGFELIVLLDPAFLGFFFAGGLVLLERDQGVLALIVTRGRGFRAWWCAKSIALTLLAGAAVSILALLAQWSGLIRLNPRGVAFLATGLFLSIPLYFSLGVLIASRFPRVLDYFVYSGIIMVPFMLPLVEIVGVSLGPAGVLSPVWGGMVLLTSIFEPLRTGPELLGAVATLLVWNTLAYRWARRAFRNLAVGATRPVGHKSGKGDRFRPFPGRAAEVALLLRDPMMRLIMLAPFPAALLLGRGMPLLLARFGVTAVTEGHMDAVRSFVIILSALMYGMLGAFLILDEKDEGILPFLKTMPGRPGWYLLRRGLTLLALFAVLLVLLVPAGNLLHGSLPVFLLSLAVDAATVILAFLAMSVLARNKVQGLAIAKVLNISSLPPLFIAVLPGRAGLLAGVFPTAWGSIIRLRAETLPAALLLALPGLLYAAGVIALLYRRAMRIS